MKKRTKIWVIIAVCLVVLGCAIFAGAMAALKWDFAALSTSTIEMTDYELDEDFGDIYIDANTADIGFFRSEDGRCKVVCYEKSNEKHNVFVNGDTHTLTVQVYKANRWQYSFMDFGEASVEIYLPETEYDALVICTDTGDVRIPAEFTFGRLDISASTADIENFASVAGLAKIKTSTGAVRIEGMSADALKLSTTTGNIAVSAVSCKGDMDVNVSTGDAFITDTTSRSIFSHGTTGDITLRNVVASEKMSITRDTGDVIFDGSDAAEMYVETSTGDVRGNLLTGKQFNTRTNTGDVAVIHSKNGGPCEIVTDTGDIFINTLN